MRCSGARAFADEELGAQRFDDRPLLRAGILPLVDQEMVDLLVELVLHPGRDAGPLEQPAGERDQVVEIERGDLAFAPVVGLEHRRADAQQRRGALGHAGRLLALDPAGQARLLRTQRGCLVRERRTAGDEIPLPGLPLGGQKHALVGGPGAHALLGVGSEPVGDGLRTRRVLVGAARERAGGGETGPR